MPISDNEDYDSGHFDRVYEYLIKPAVSQAGFIPLRADDVRKTNYIILDILKRLIESDMAICDLSSRNPNVLYELGIRQAFDKPVAFIKDEKTERIFDIQGFRDFEYSSNLRIDEVEKEREKLSEMIVNTYSNENKDVNSIIDLLSISKASIKNEINISPELSIVMQSLEEINTKVSKLQEDIGKTQKDTEIVNQEYKFADIRTLKEGDIVYHSRFGKGKIESLTGNQPNSWARINFIEGGNKSLVLKFAKLARIEE